MSGKDLVCDKCNETPDKIREIVGELLNLKCCGNCKHFDTEEHHGAAYDHNHCDLTGESKEPYRACPLWEFDNVKDRST
jgi:hypothetical protein